MSGVAVITHVSPGRRGLAWQDQAACRTASRELFYPDKGGSTREAKAVCWSCQVRDECLQYALDNDDRHGIWGGTSPNDRENMAGAR